MDTVKGHGACFREFTTILNEWTRKGVISIPGYYLMVLVLDEALFGEELAGPVYVNGAVLDEIHRITRRSMQKREAFIARFIKNS